jgi:adenylate kinase family enzyme
MAEFHHLGEEGLVPKRIENALHSAGFSILDSGYNVLLGENFLLDRFPRWEPLLDALNGVLRESVPILGRYLYRAIYFVAQR